MTEFTKEDRIALLKIAFAEGVTVKKRGELVEFLDNCPSALLDGNFELSNLSEVLSEKAIEGIKNAFLKSEGYYEDVLRRAGAKYLTIFDGEYPEMLREINNAPAILFYKGELSALSKDNIAVIGSRHCSNSAVRHAQTFARDLALGGFTVVSGLARGLDSEALRSAINAGGRTVAVLGSGIDVVYPSENKELFDLIEESGIIVSEYVPGTKPNGYQFPERNRIISGLSRGVLVIEAGENSGALITANLAIEQSREVFVIPSSIDSACARGSNLFLKEYPSALVTEPEDIFRALNVAPPITERSAMELDVMEEKIVTALEKGPMHFDELLEISGLNSNNLNS